MLQHTNLFGQGFLSKKQCDNTGVYPDMATADFYVFPWLNSAVKGWHFCDGTDIIKKEIPEKSFTKWLPEMLPTPLQSLAEAYSCTMGLFWRKYSLNDCIILYLSDIKWFQEHSEATAYNIPQKNDSPSKILFLALIYLYLPGWLKNLHIYW